MAKKRDDVVGTQPTNEEQMQRRQSAPRMSAQEALFGMMGATDLPTDSESSNGSVDGFRALNAPIGKEAIQKATQILQRYKEGKANLENRIVENEQWYKMRHWECMRKNSEHQIQPPSGWLFNCIANKHADAMDNFPRPNVLPREEGDKGDAKMLSDILPVVLSMNDFEKAYSDAWMYKLKFGTGVYGVYWSSDKLNGLGDIDIVKLDLLSLFWEPGITDLQKSKNLFHVELVDNEELVSMYPQLAGKLGSSTLTVSHFVYDDSVDTSDKSCVIDWYYKKRNESGKQILHYCKYVNDEVLFATENETQPSIGMDGMPIPGSTMAERGLYDHGKYPVVLDPLFTTEGTPTGFGYIDVGKSAQEYIDRGNQAILQNMLANSKPRHFVRNDGSVNEEEYANLDNDFIHVDGNLGQDSILPVQGKPLNDIYVTVINNKIDELKEVTGNRDISTGGTSSGVTASSAIAALQESGSKLSRSAIRQSYRVFRELCLMCIELIRQFYDMPRCFRIVGENGMQQFVQYSNQGILPQAQGNDFGMDMGFRIPLFDIDVTAEKNNAYSRMSQNELALQLYGLGFFDPSRADQALACLDMMDFDRKEFVMNKISQSGGMMQQMMMLAQMADNAMGTGGEITNSLAAQYGMPVAQSAQNNGAGSAQNNSSLGGDDTSAGEPTINKKAKQRVADSISPS